MMLECLSTSDEMYFRCTEGALHSNLELGSCNQSGISQKLTLSLSRWELHLEIWPSCSFLSFFSYYMAQL